MRERYEIREMRNYKKREGEIRDEREMRHE